MHPAEVLAVQIRQFAGVRCGPLHPSPAGGFAVPGPQHQPVLVEVAEFRFCLARNAECSAFGIRLPQWPNNRIAEAPLLHAVAPTDPHRLALTTANHVSMRKM
jgi:hypothetical protein